MHQGLFPWHVLQTDCMTNFVCDNSLQIIQIKKIKDLNFLVAPLFCALIFLSTVNSLFCTLEIGRDQVHLM